MVRGRPIKKTCACCGDKLLIREDGKRNKLFCGGRGTCLNARNHPEWWKEYLARKNKYAAVYRDKNLERIRQRAKDYRRSNKDKLNSRRRKLGPNQATKNRNRIRCIKERAELKALRIVMKELGIYEEIKREINAACAVVCKVS